MAVAGICELAGLASFALGARDGIAVTAVVGSQFAAISVVAAWFVFHERLSRLQVVGVATIIAGVATLAFLRS